MHVDRWVRSRSSAVVVCFGCAPTAAAAGAVRCGRTPHHALSLALTPLAQADPRRPRAVLFFIVPRGHPLGLPTNPSFPLPPPPPSAAHRSAREQDGRMRGCSRGWFAEWFSFSTPHGAQSLVPRPRATRGVLAPSSSALRQRTRKYAVEAGLSSFGHAPSQVAKELQGTVLNPARLPRGSRPAAIGTSCVFWP